MVKTMLAVALAVSLFSGNPSNNKGPSKKINILVQCMTADTCKSPTRKNDTKDGPLPIMLIVSLSDERQDVIVFNNNFFATREYVAKTGLSSFVFDLDFDGVVDTVQVYNESSELIFVLRAKDMTKEEKKGFQKYFDDTINKALSNELIGPEKKYN